MQHISLTILILFSIVACGGPAASSQEPVVSQCDQGAPRETCEGATPSASGLVSIPINGSFEENGILPWSSTSWGTAYAIGTDYRAAKNGYRSLELAGVSGQHEIHSPLAQLTASRTYTVVGWAWTPYHVVTVDVAWLDASGEVIGRHEGALAFRASYCLAEPTQCYVEGRRTIIAPEEATAARLDISTSVDRYTGNPGYLDAFQFLSN